VQQTNFAQGDPKLVDRAAYDYRLALGSPCINAGSDPGTGAGFALLPTRQYVHLASAVDRTIDGTIDIGAYELGLPVDGGADAGSDVSDAGAPPPRDASDATSPPRTDASDAGAPPPRDVASDSAAPRDAIDAAMPRDVSDVSISSDASDAGLPDPRDVSDGGAPASPDASEGGVSPPPSGGGDGDGGGCGCRTARGGDATGIPLAGLALGLLAAWRRVGNRQRAASRRPQRSQSNDVISAL
jgi:MYXO-CTERM domain-containing protein